MAASESADRQWPRTGDAAATGLPGSDGWCGEVRHRPGQRRRRGSGGPADASGPTGHHTPTGRLLAATSVNTRSPARRIPGGPSDFTDRSLTPGRATHEQRCTQGDWCSVSLMHFRLAVGDIDMMRPAPVTYLTDGGLMVAVVFALIGGFPLDMPMPTHAFGWVEPTCGLTRGSTAMARSDFATAWHYNPLLFLVMRFGFAGLARAFLGSDDTSVGQREGLLPSGRVGRVRLGGHRTRALSADQRRLHHRLARPTDQDRPRGAEPRGGSPSQAM